MPRTKHFLSGEDFHIWRASRGITSTELAQWLGKTRSAIRELEKRGISVELALALSALDNNLEPWRPTETERQVAAVPVSRYRVLSDPNRLRRNEKVEDGASHQGRMESPARS